MLEVRGVSKRFGSIAALSDVWVSVARGEVVAIVGENGAGKSTLVRCLARATRPDEGQIFIDGVEIGSRPRDAIDRGLAVVWQDLALCNNLDVTANLFLGRELDRLGALHARAMVHEADKVLSGLGIELPVLDCPIERLSGGQRQLVAIARAVMNRPEVLVLDEPTASLGVIESQAVLDVLRTLRSDGVAIVLVSHQLETVFDIADRIVVFRHGRAVADLHRAETHPDDVVAIISGADLDTTAARQLRRLHSLAEQLADADESAVLPLTVSSLSSALSTDRLAIYLVDQPDSADLTDVAPTAEVVDSATRLLRRSASLHLPVSLASELRLLPLDATSFVGQAAVTSSLVVAPRLDERAGDRVAEVASAHGLAGAWAAPIVGQEGTLAVMVGFHIGQSPLQDDQIRLLELFSTMAGSAIDRGRLVERLRRRNSALEGLRGVLEKLAGPDLLTSGFVSAVDALCGGVGSDMAVLYVDHDHDPNRASSTANDGRLGGWAARAVSTGLVVGGATEQQLRRSIERDRVIGNSAVGAQTTVVAAEFEWSRGRAALVCGWLGGAGNPSVPFDADALVADAANSFRLAMEREVALEVERASAVAQHNRELERALTLRLGHELRTPLTAIRGFASTLLQPDVTWPDDEQQRFLQIIEREAGRMARLVAELFDETAIESGALRLEPNYCDLVAILVEAASIAAPAGAVILDLPDACNVWGDRDRLEQVFVNLIANAVRHNDDDITVRISTEWPLAGDGAPATDLMVVRVEDDGVGMPASALEYLNGQRLDRPNDEGLGLRLIKGLVEAHRGTVRAAVDDGTTVLVTLPIDGGLDPTGDRPV